MLKALSESRTHWHGKTGLAHTRPPGQNLHLAIAMPLFLQNAGS